MSDNPLQYYKKRVNRLIGNSLAPEPDSPRNYNLPDFNLYQRKATHAGMAIDPTIRDISLQKQSLLNALNNSYDSERIRLIIDPTGETDTSQDYLAIIKNAQTTWFTSEHMIAMDPDTNPAGVGSTLDWLRTGYKYLVMFKDYDTKAFFSGNIERANYLIKWTDEGGNLYQQWAVVRGPTQKDTAFRKASGGDIIVDKGENKFEMFLGKTEATPFLRRYNRIILKDPSIGHTRGWIINVIDDVTNKHLIRVDLEENFIDQITDNYIEGIAYNYGLSSTLSTGTTVTAVAQDYVVTKTNHGLGQGQPIYNTTLGNLFINYIDKDTFNVSTISNGTPIQLTTNFATQSFVYNILVSDYVINGSDFIKHGQNYEYDLRINNNTNTSTNATYWYLGGQNNLSIGSAGGYSTTSAVFVTLINANTIKLKLGNGATVGSTISLAYNNGSNINLTKNIEIVSLISSTE